MNVEPKLWTGRSCLASRSLVVATLIVLLLDIVEPQATCHFPEYLQSSNFQGIKKTWSTGKWWVNLRHTFSWEEKKEIYVKKGILVKTREVNKDCKKMRRHTYKPSLGSCTEESHVYNQTCISKERDNKYRVIQLNQDGTHLFKCIRFERRSDNVVQVYEGGKSVSNDSDLCDGEFELDKWPWIAPRNRVSSKCPVSGGFRFRTMRRLFNEDLCEDEWRSSTLEIDCMSGDGMMFMAPQNSNCNPFLRDGDNKRLLCWAGWKTKDYIFMVAADEGKQPTYCLRFPVKQEGEFSVIVYFSVICPTDPRGTPSPGIEYYELHMHRKDPTHCRDDNPEKCKEFSNYAETCKSDVSIYPHCAKTCRQCATSIMEDIRHHRCSFDANLKSDWVLYDKIGVHDVTIDTNEVMMTQLATFHCLNTGRKDNETVYKSISLFPNGCSPRYTCLQFKRNNNNILHYKIGPSYREELKVEDLCVFRDDPPPLKDSIRSTHMKNLIYKGDFWSSHCGLDGVIPFNGTINGHHCVGTVSDWDETSCAQRGVMTFRANNCSPLVLDMEFQCLGYVYNETIPLRRLLFTKSMDGKLRYNCWVITSYFDQAPWPKPLMYQMPDAQCSLLMEVQKSDYSTSPIHVYLEEDSKHTDCRPGGQGRSGHHHNNHHHVTQMEMTPPSNVSYVLSLQPDHRPPSSTDKHQEILIHPDPHKGHNSRTDKPHRSVQGGDGRGAATRVSAKCSGNSRYVVLVLISISLSSCFNILFKFDGR